jgi:4a-hydroxytetrahydrobiopterin dehydratase
VVAHRDGPTREGLVSTLPNQLAGLVRDSAPLSTDRGRTPFLQTVASELDTSPERARFLAQAVLSEPTELSDEDVAAALTSLPGWTGDVRALERTVVLPDGIGQELRDRIARVEQAMNHHAVVEERPDGTVFRVWTHARGVVTDLDVELAGRISEVIEGS